MSEEKVSISTITHEIPDLQDAEWLAEYFSEQFHEQAIVPDYRICNFGQRRQVWEIIEFEDCMKTVKDFLPHCKMPEQWKKNLFYKAERANQSLMACQLLGNYLWSKAASNNLYFRGKRVEGVHLQWLTVIGHTNPFIDEWEKNLIDNKQTFPILGLNVNDGSVVYLDICATQIDIGSYGKNDFPFLIREAPLIKDELYSEDHNRNVSIYSVDDLVPITSDLQYVKYLEGMEEDFSEEVRFFNEFMYKTIRNNLKKKSLADRKKRTKKGIKFVPPTDPTPTLTTDPTPTADPVPTDPVPTDPVPTDPVMT